MSSHAARKAQCDGGCRRDVHVEQRLILMAIPLQRFPAVSPPEADTRGWFRLAIREVNTRRAGLLLPHWHLKSVKRFRLLKKSLYDSIHFMRVIDLIWFGRL